MKDRYFFNKNAGKNAFVLQNGEKINTIKHLYVFLDRMDDSVFTHHVNDAKNDFAAWINDIFDQKKLAEDLQAIKTKKKMKKVLENWISHVIHSKHKTEKKKSIEKEELIPKKQVGYWEIVFFMFGFILGAIVMFIIVNVI